jgi:ornithine carbamoyltransferase
MKRDLLSIRDLSGEEIHRLIDRAIMMKSDLQKGVLKQALSRKVLALIFEKPSTRTRVSFEAAMYRLGGQCIYLSSKDTQISRQEPLKDTARVLSRYVDGIMIRTFSQQDVETLARFASIPVINGLTDHSHPCQVLADLMTIKEKRADLQNLNVAWIGDGNNMANSWIYAAAKLNFTLHLACPPAYSPADEVLQWARSQNTGSVFVVEDPKEAVASADVLNTDVWASMGQEEEAETRKAVFRPYRIDSELLASAPPHAIVLHCLPAHRSEEITEEVLEGPQSFVFDQAENRLHLQMAVLEWLIGGRAL